MTAQITTKEADSIAYCMDSETVELLHGKSPATPSEWLQAAIEQLGEDAVREYALLAMYADRVEEVMGDE